MEQSYFCYEQIYQMQATYDAIIMLKIVHDAGGDPKDDPIHFFCYEWGEQASIFYEALNRIFGECQNTWSQNEYYEETNRIRIPLPQLKELYALVTSTEAKTYIKKFEQMLSKCCDQFEMEMKGFIQDDQLYVTISGSYGVYSSLLKQLVAIRSEVMYIIHERKRRILHRLRNIFMLKTVFDRLGTTVAASVEEDSSLVLSRIMEHCSFDYSPEAIRSLSYEEMLKLLEHVLDQVEHKKNKEGEAA